MLTKLHKTLLRRRAGSELRREVGLRRRREMGDAIATTRPDMAVLLLLVLLLLQTLSAIAHTNSVSELEKRMYTAVDANACVRLLNLTGQLGCGNPRRTLVVAPIRRFDTASSVKLDVLTSVLIPASELQAFLERLGDNPSLLERIAGVVVEPSGSGEFLGLGFSADSKFPQSEFAPYDRKDYEWNPAGSGIMQLGFDFPVFLLSSQESTSIVQQMAAKNADKGSNSPAFVAEFNAVMQTTKEKTLTSESCLTELSCLPLGGYSVLSTMPTVNVSAPTVKPIVLAMASMDSASFFRDVAPGADSRMSGVLALLAAVDALSNVGGMEILPNRLLFLVLTGESMGYLGSRQFLEQLQKGSLSNLGIEASSIVRTVEVGSVGQASNSTFFIHKHANAAAVPTQEIIDSLQSSATSSSLNVNLASKSNPGIPPSSLMPFIQIDSATPGVVIEEFDTAFKNRFYHSQFDDLTNVNTTAIVAASSLVARSLLILASGNLLRSDSPAVTSIQVNASLVDEMVECFYNATPGLRCRLVESLMTASQDSANHYVGVFTADPRSSPEVYDDTSRFVWNFLADRINLQDTQGANSSSHAECTFSCKNPEEVCVGATEKHMGQCVVSSTRYLPAYSPRLAFDSSGWRLLPLKTGDKMGAADPVYTESFWGSISLQVYQQENSWYEEVVLFFGVCVALISIVCTFSSSTILQKRMKWA